MKIEPWSEEVASGVIDYYFTKAIVETGLEIVTLPVFPVYDILKGFPSMIDPVLAGLNGAVYKYYFNRSDPLITPFFLSGKNKSEKNGAVFGAVAGNFATSFLPIPGSNPAAIVGGMLVGRQILKKSKN